MMLTEYESIGRTFVVAEIAQAHDGSLGILHSLVDAAAMAGVDAVKFQVHIAEAESSALEPFRVQFSPTDETRFDYWKRMELTAPQWRDLKCRCEAAGVEFLATPFSNAAVDLLESIGVVRYKISSGDLANPLLLERLARTDKEVILSTGLAALEEIDAAVALMRTRQIPVAVLQCTTKYPTAAHEIGLPWLATLRTRYECPVGLSDHSGTIYAALGAVSLGANIIEAHITFDRRMFGPDAKASLTVDEFAELVRGVRFLEQARSKGPDKTIDESKQELRRMFGKAIAINRNMQEGEILRFEDLESKKPADGGLPVAKISEVIGCRLNKAKKQWDFLMQDDIE